MEVIERIDCQDCNSDDCAGCISRFQTEITRLEKTNKMLVKQAESHSAKEWVAETMNMVSKKYEAQKTQLANAGKVIDKVRVFMPLIEKFVDKDNGNWTPSIWIDNYLSEHIRSINKTLADYDKSKGGASIEANTAGESRIDLINRIQEGEPELHHTSSATPHAITSQIMKSDVCETCGGEMVIGVHGKPCPDCTGKVDHHKDIASEGAHSVEDEADQGKNRTLR